MGFTWTDNPLTGVIREIHVRELRTNINALRAFAGFSPYSFSDPTIVPLATKDRMVHINEMREALEVFRPFTWSGNIGQMIQRVDTTILIRAQHIIELRTACDALLEVQQSMGLNYGTITAIEGGSPTPLKHIRVTVHFNGPYVSLPSGNPTFVFTSSNTGVLPNLSATVSPTVGSTSHVFDFPSNVFSGLGSAYYSVDVSNYPELNHINTNSVTIIESLVATSCNTSDTEMAIGEGANLTTTLNRSAESGETIRLTSSNGTSSGFSQFRGVGYQDIMMTPGSTQFNYGITAAYTTPYETVTATPNDGSATTAPMAIIQPIGDFNDVANFEIYPNYASGSMSGYFMEIKRTAAHQGPDPLRVQIVARTTIALWALGSSVTQSGAMYVDDYLLSGGSSPVSTQTLVTSNRTYPYAWAGGDPATAGYVYYQTCLAAPINVYKGHAYGIAFTQNVPTVRSMMYAAPGKSCTRAADVGHSLFVYNDTSTIWDMSAVCLKSSCSGFTCDGYNQPTGLHSGNGFSAQALSGHDVYKSATVASAPPPDYIYHDASSLYHAPGTSIDNPSPGLPGFYWEQVNYSLSGINPSDQSGEIGILGDYWTYGNMYYAMKNNCILGTDGMDFFNYTAQFNSYVRMWEGVPPYMSIVSPSFLSNVGQHGSVAFGGIHQISGTGGYQPSDIYIFALAHIPTIYISPAWNIDTAGSSVRSHILNTGSGRNYVTPRDSTLSVSTRGLYFQA